MQLFFFDKIAEVGVKCFWRILKSIKFALEMYKELKCTRGSFKIFLYWSSFKAFKVILDIIDFC